MLKTRTDIGDHGFDLITCGMRDGQQQAGLSGVVRETPYRR